jgi:hypothetical protein
MSADKKIPDIPQDVIESLARTILPSIRNYFDSDEGQQEFTEWKKQKDNEQAAVETIKPK